jgi:hypothetical protein
LICGLEGGRDSFGSGMGVSITLVGRGGRKGFGILTGELGIIWCLAQAAMTSKIMVKMTFNGDNIIYSDY